MDKIIWEHNVRSLEAKTQEHRRKTTLWFCLIRRFINPKPFYIQTTVSLITISEWSKSDNVRINHTVTGKDVNICSMTEQCNQYVIVGRNSNEFDLDERINLNFHYNENFGKHSFQYIWRSIGMKNTVYFTYDDPISYHYIKIETKSNKSAII